MSKILVVIGAIIVVLAGGWWYYDTHRAAPPLATAATPGGASGASAPSGSVALSADDRFIGKPDAPITIIEYASMTCPHCAEFHRETLPKLKEAWIDTGKAKLVFRDYPLDGSAVKASLLARCAPPDKFYGYIDILFKSQEAWAHSPDPVPALQRFAKLGGMSDEQFQACMKDDVVQNKIIASRLAGEKEFKVESTPTFIINGKRLVGAQPFQAFDDLLKTLEPKA
jgi:protein-disulfide isomerase